MDTYGHESREQEAPADGQKASVGTNSCAAHAYAPAEALPAARGSTPDGAPAVVDTSWALHEARGSQHVAAVQDFRSPAQRRPVARAREPSPATEHWPHSAHVVRKEQHVASLQD